MRSLFSEYLSLDLTKILTVEFDGENTLFEEFLERKNPMHAVAA